MDPSAPPKQARLDLQLIKLFFNHNLLLLGFLLWLSVHVLCVNKTTPVPSFMLYNVHVCPKSDGCLSLQVRAQSVIVSQFGATAPPLTLLPPDPSSDKLFWPATDILLQPRFQLKTISYFILAFRASHKTELHYASILYDLNFCLPLKTSPKHLL